jgi:hypothetical protein
LAVALAALGGIAAILGWLPTGLGGDTPVSIAPPGLRIAGTAPPESLSPGEAIVTEAPKAPAIEEKAPPAAGKPPAPKPSEAQPPKPASRKKCPNCGTVTSLTFHAGDPRGSGWQVAVNFDDGTRMTMRYPTNPGFRVGERVILANGRLSRN